MQAGPETYMQKCDVALLCELTSTTSTLAQRPAKKIEPQAGCNFQAFHMQIQD
jgi:hypothetical protein